MLKEAEDATRMAMLNAETNHRLSELWDIMAPNFYYPAEDEIACYLLGPSSTTQPCGEATTGAFTDFNALKND